MLGVAPANIRVIDLLIMPGVTPPAVGRLHQGWSLVQWHASLEVVWSTVSFDGLIHFGPGISCDKGSLDKKQMFSNSWTAPGWSLVLLAGGKPGQLWRRTSLRARVKAQASCSPSGVDYADRILTTGQQASSSKLQAASVKQLDIWI